MSPEAGLVDRFRSAAGRSAVVQVGFRLARSSGGLFVITGGPRRLPTQRSMALWSCALVILERPLTPLRFASS